MSMANGEKGQVYVLENTTINQAFKVGKNVAIFALPVDNQFGNLKEGRQTMQNKFTQNGTHT